MSKWISVNEKLPESGKVVVGSGYIYGKKENGRWVEPVVYSREDLEFHPPAQNECGETVADLDSEMHAITHWQHMPEPPAE